MSIINLESIISVVPVKDHAVAVIWYKKLFGRGADVVPIEGIAEWQITEKAWLQVTTDSENVGNTTVIINVSDLDAQRTACAEASVSLGEVVEYPGIVKMVVAVDPAGNKITFVQVLS